MVQQIRSGEVGYGGNPLDAAREEFRRLSSGDHPVMVDGRGFDHLPDREIPVDELRARLLAAGCPRQVWDQVWSHVIRRARAEGGSWSVVAVGLALPMLTALAARLTARYADDPRDVHAEVVAGFLAALHTLDLDRGRIAIRLRWAAYRAGHRALLEALETPQPAAPDGRVGTPDAGGHPDLVLARAIREEVLSRSEADLIGTTRLDGVELGAWPHRAGRSYEGLRSQRRRAEQRLRAWLEESVSGEADAEPAGRGARTRCGRVAGSGPRPEKGVESVTDVARNSRLQGCA